MMGIGMAVRPPRSRGPVLMMIDALRRIGGSLWMVDNAFSGAFVDNVGTTPVTAVGDLIGKVLDKTGTNHATQSAVASKPSVQRVPKRLGPNLVVINSWTAPAIGGPAFSVFNTNGFYSASKQYVISAVVSGYSGTGAVGFVGSGALNASSVPVIGGNGTIYAVLPTVASADMNISLFTRSTNTAVFTNVVVQEVLEWANVISFDGSNDFLQTGITTGNEGFLAAAVTPANTTTAMSVVNSGEGTATIPGVWLYASGAGTWLAGSSNGTVRTLAGRAMTGAVPQVVSMGWDASSVFVGVDGAETSAARTGNCASGANVLRIGMYQGSSVPFNGPMHAVVYSAVDPDAATRKVIINGLAALQGRTL